MSTPSAHSRRLSIDSSSRPSAKRHKTDSSTDSAIDTPSPPPEPDRDNSDVTSSLPPLPDNEDQSERPSKSGKRTYTSSIYVDAFNLALNTVLKDEAYLFSEEEAEVFAKYRSFEYEAQHLYALPKTDVSIAADPPW